MIDDILAPLVVDLHEVGRRREWDELIAFAASVDFLVGPGVDLGRDGFAALGGW